MRAWIGLGRQRGFTGSVVLVLALGIGANATMFAIVDRLLLRPPALVDDPARVVTTDFVRSFQGSPIHQDFLSYPQYLDLAGTSGVFSGVAAYSAGKARHISGIAVHGNVLLWQRDGLTLRLQGHFDRADAIEIAKSVR